MLRYKLVNNFKKMFKFYSDNNFINSENSIYLEQMYEKWLEDRGSVHSSWNAYFTNISNNKNENESFSQIPGKLNNLSSSNDDVNINLHSKLSSIVKSWRQNGHLYANICPIETEYGKINLRKIKREETKLKNFFGIEKNEENKTIKFNEISKGFHKSKKEWNAKELSKSYQEIYAGPISFQYYHIPQAEIKNWIIEKIEKIPCINKTKEEKKNLLKRIIKSQEFSKFCEKKFSNSKRFGIEGLDASISGLNHLVNISGKNNVNQLVFGMAHRGRLNTLACVLGMPIERIFAEMLDNMDKDTENLVKNFSDDKYYHLPSSIKKKFDNGNVLDVSLLPNPSHLETVNPLVMGKSRAKMDYLYKNKDNFNLIEDENETVIPLKDYVIPIIIHGDAAISGQGIVYECIQMSNLNGFKVGGTIHLVFNNLLGFTTDQKEARSSMYSTEVGKLNNSFIIHVSAEYPEYVDYAMELAFEYRQKFNLDVFVDLVGYRQFGHNEQDNAKMTQPLMYNEINQLKKNPMYKKYYNKLINENVVTQQEINDLEKEFSQKYLNAYEKSKENLIKEEKKESSTWKNLLKRVHNELEVNETGFDSLEDIRNLSEKIFKIPESFKPNSTVNKLYSKWLETIKTGKKIRWATAEHLAFGKLLEEGYGVRLVGEDVNRGTFAHRHIGIINTETNEKNIVMNNLLNKNNKYNLQIYNSLLSEYAVMGYEYGYSIANPNNLTIWEAQFGDFNNVAQPIIDQYIVSAEKKWKYYSGLTLFLPHGIDGLGPEHSSCRLERFLQLVDDDYYHDDLYEDCKEQWERINLQICNITKPANFFHVLRRQLYRNFRKPLIIATPKKLFTLPENESNIEEFLTPNKFNLFYDEEFLDEVDTNLSNIKKVLVCSGQFYFDLLKERRRLINKDTVIIRIEQIAPFNYSKFIDILKNYPNADVTYCQEEPLNSGSFEYLKPRINRCLEELGKEEINYIGRKALACPSEGTKKKHEKSLNELLKKAFPN